MEKKCAIVHVKTRNEAITIGALVIQKELEEHGWQVDIVTYEQAHQYRIVLVSMTSTWDLYEFYRSMKKARWDKREFIAILGGFGCQNPFALRNFVDFAFFGRAEFIISEVCEKALKGSDLQEYEFISPLRSPRLTIARPVQKLYKYEIKYGKNHGRWREEFTGCPFKCKFCHYTFNRRNVRNGDPKKYINDNLSTGSKEVMLMDVIDFEEKAGRVTAGLDGYSERLRRLFGKPITWDLMEQSLDHMAQFKGNSYMKIYNISNFPTETPLDEKEFLNFFREYTSSTTKPDGVLSVEVFNTAFRPSINTPMERMPVSLFPEARRENLRIAQSKGINIKYTHLIQGALMHLLDVIAIRYDVESDFDLIDYLASDKTFVKKNNKQKLNYLDKTIDLHRFLRRYSWEEPMVSDLVRNENYGQIRRSAKMLEKKMYGYESKNEYTPEQKKSPLYCREDVL